MTQTVKEIISTFDHLPLSEQKEVTKIILRRRLEAKTSSDVKTEDVIERSGTIDENHQIILDEDLPDHAPNRVRVIVLFDDPGSDTPSGRRKAGSAEGLINIASDFDTPLEGFEEYQP